MWINLCLASALLVAAVSPTWAQTAKPTSAEAAAEAAAAMERAQRLAANPMRVILQAGKIRRRVNEPEPAADAVDAANLRRAAAAVAAAGTTTTVAATTGTATAAVVTRTTPVEAVPAVTTALVLQASQLSGPAANWVAGLESTGAPLVLPVAMPKMAPTQTLLAALPVTQPKLVLTVEPEIPTRFLQDTGRVSEVQADLSLRADGTVADVQLIAPYPRSWRSYIVAALEKWRFEPLASARTHRIQLVFSE